ncbi:hypothetical protein TNCV_4279311 [Trichonephila clavipes]|nr:hypothetical protein TNCV_4279311 [Trichonephila clavipes]
MEGKVSNAKRHRSTSTLLGVRGGGEGGHKCSFSGPPMIGCGQLRGRQLTTTKLTFHPSKVIGYEPRNFYPLSCDENDTSADILLSQIPHHVNGRTLSLTDLTYISPSTRRVFSSTRTRTHDATATTSGSFPLGYPKNLRENSIMDSSKNFKEAT